MDAEEANLVHEVTWEVGSRGEAESRDILSVSRWGEAYWKERSVIVKEDVVGRQVSVTTEEEQVFLVVWAEMRLRR